MGDPSRRLAGDIGMMVAAAEGQPPPRTLGCFTTAEKEALEAIADVKQALSPPRTKGRRWEEADGGGQGGAWWSSSSWMMEEEEEEEEEEVRLDGQLKTKTQP